MSYTVKYKNNVEIAVNSIDEAVLLAERLAKLPSNGDVLSASTSPPPRSGAIIEFVAGLKDEAKNALRVILENGGTMGADQLRRALHMDTGMELAGTVISPVIKTAKKVGLEPSDVFLRRKKKHPNGQKVNEYTIPAVSREEIRRELKM